MRPMMRKPELSMGYLSQRSPTKYSGPMTPRAEHMMMMPERFGETRLPNEIRINSDSSIGKQVNIVLATLSHGYEHCKVVGRGRAVSNVLGVIEVVKRRLADYSFYMSETKSLNKSGHVCDELHVLISAPRKGPMEGS